MNTKRYCLIAALAAAIGLGGFKALNAWNARLTPEKIAAGKVLFEHEWSVDDSLCGEGDGLGPVFNANSCVACHSQGGVGGASGNARNVTAFEIQMEDETAVPPSGVVHADAVDKSSLESETNLRRLFPIRSKQVTVVEGGGMYGPDCESTPFRQRTIEEKVDPVIFHELNSPALFGAGLIDDISNVSITFHGHKRMANRIANEMSGEFGGNRLGMINMIDGGIGKFGWKGQFDSLEDFVASACAMEIGLTNPMHSQPVAKEHRVDNEAKMDMTKRQLHELVCFVRSLPRPQQVLPTEPQALERVVRGEQVFAELGCADCHVESLAGIDGIYSDFHLYNLEPVKRIASSGYSDGKSEQEFDFDRTHPHPDQWQTPALWGVADSAPYFHDGGSPNLTAAILRHEGQAISSKQRFEALPKRDQICLIKFLGTLKAPVE